MIRRALACAGQRARRAGSWRRGLLRRLGAEFAAASAREVFAMLARGVPDYAGLDYRVLGGSGRVLAPGEAGATQEARA